MQVSHCLEWGATSSNPRTRDNLWFRAILSDSKPEEGIIFKMGRRPRARRNEDPHPTVRLMRENPAGMLFAKVKSGEIRVENYFDFVNRMTLMRRDEDEKLEKKNGKK